MAASVCEKYIHYEDVLYERARKYLEAAEMKVGMVLQHSLDIG